MRSKPKSLNDIFLMQFELMEALGIDVEGYVDIYGDEFMAACIGLASEALEVLDEINIATRPWAVKREEEARKVLAKEAIDALFYFVEIMIFLRVSPSIVFELYEEKWHINMERIRKREKNV